MTKSNEYVRFSAGSVDITPTFPVPLSGYCARTKSFQPATGRPLRATAIRFHGDKSSPLLISLDLLYPSKELREHLLREFEPRLKPQDLFLSATHTHFAPAVDRTKPLMGAADDSYVQFVSHQLATLVEELLDGEPRPGTLHYGEQFGNHSVNRRLLMDRPVLIGHRVERRRLRFAPNLQGPKDEKIRVVTVMDPSGEMAAVVWNYTCHPVYVFDSESGGPAYPGIIRDTLQRTWGDGVNVLFFQGFAGDVRPYSFGQGKNPKQWMDELRKGPSFVPPTESEQVIWHETLSERVCDAVRMASGREPLAGQPFAERREYSLGHLLASPPPDRVFSIARLDFGERLRFLFLSAEPVAAYSADLKGLSYGRYTFPVGYVDDVFGYVPTESMIEEGGYEAGEFFEPFSLKGGFQPDLEKRVKTAMKEALRGGEQPDTRRTYSVTDIEEGLRALGLKQGDLVIARGALMALGQVRGKRTDVFLTALRNVIGPSGTMVGLAFIDCLSNPLG